MAKKLFAEREAHLPFRVGPSAGLTLKEAKEAPSVVDDAGAFYGGKVSFHIGPASTNLTEAGCIRPSRMQQLGLTEHRVTKPAAAKLADAWNETLSILGPYCLHIRHIKGRDADVKFQLETDSASEHSSHIQPLIIAAAA